MVDQITGVKATVQEIENNLAAIVCPTHKIGLVQSFEHIGDGHTRLSEPFCPACRSIEAGKPFDPSKGNQAAHGSDPSQAGEVAAQRDPPSPRP